MTRAATKTIPFMTNITGNFSRQKQVQPRNMNFMKRPFAALVLARSRAALMERRLRMLLLAKAREAA